MSKTKHKGRPARPAMTNAVQVAIDRARVMTRADKDLLTRTAQEAFDKFRRGIECDDAFRSMADAFNLSAQMTELGIGVDDATKWRTQGALRILGVVLHRFEHLGTWALRSHEMLDLEEGLATFRLQIELVSFAEYLKARRRVCDITRQALAGNAAPGVEVIATKRL